MRNLFVICALSALVLSACKKKDEGGETPPVAEKPKAPDEATPPDDNAQSGGDAAATDTMKNKMKNCPSAVEGAATSIEKTEKGIRVTIAHKDAAKLAEIKARAEHLVKVAGKADTDIKHTGQGTGGGAIGHCPAGIKNTTAKLTAKEGSVMVDLEPMEGATQQDLYKTATKRAQKINEGAAGGHEHGSGTGGGKGGGGGKGEGEKQGGPGAAAKKADHEHGSGSGAAKGGGGKGAAKGDQDGKPGK